MSDNCAIEKISNKFPLKLAQVTEYTLKLKNTYFIMGTYDVNA